MQRRCRGGARGRKGRREGTEWGVLTSAQQQGHALWVTLVAQPIQPYGPHSYMDTRADSFMQGVWRPRALQVPAGPRPTDSACDMQSAGDMQCTIACESRERACHIVQCIVHRIVHRHVVHGSPPVSRLQVPDRLVVHTLLGCIMPGVVPPLPRGVQVRVRPQAIEAVPTGCRAPQRRAARGRMSMSRRLRS